MIYIWYKYFAEYKFIRKSGLKQKNTQKLSVPKISYAGKDHGNIQSVCGFNNLLVPDGSAGLHKRCGTGFCRHFKRIRKGEECVRSNGGSCKGGTCLLNSDLCRINPAHLAGTDAEGTFLVGKDDRVALCMLADFPCYPQCMHLISGRVSVGYHIPLLLVRKRPLYEDAPINSAHFVCIHTIREDKNPHILFDLHRFECIFRK